MKRTVQQVSALRGSCNLAANKIDSPNSRIYHSEDLERAAANDRGRRRYAKIEAGLPVKRDNDFNIATAEDSTQTDSAPTNEDRTEFNYFAPVSFGSARTLNVHARRCRRC